MNTPWILTSTSPLTSEMLKFLPSVGEPGSRPVARRERHVRPERGAAVVRGHEPHVIERVRHESRYGRGHEVVGEVAPDRLRGRSSSCSSAPRLRACCTSGRARTGSTRSSPTVRVRRAPRSSRRWRSPSVATRTCRPAGRRPTAERANGRLLEAEVGRLPGLERGREVDDAGARVGRDVREPGRRALVAVLVAAREVAGVDVAGRLARRAGNAHGLPDVGRRRPGRRDLLDPLATGMEPVPSASQIPSPSKPNRPPSSGADSGIEETGDDELFSDADQRVVRPLVRPLVGVVAGSSCRCPRR